jgi:Na+/H+ antiporter 1
MSPDAVDLGSGGLGQGSQGSGLVEGAVGSVLVGPGTRRAGPTWAQFLRAHAPGGWRARAGVTHLVRWRRWGALPAGMHPREIVGVAALGGIGFTVSLFITDLAFDDAGLIGQAKVGSSRRRSWPP